MNKKIFYLSIILILVSIGIHIHHSYSINNYSLQYRYINIKDVAMADLSEKNNTKANQAHKIQNIAHDAPAHNEKS